MKYICSFLLLLIPFIFNEIEVSGKTLEGEFLIEFENNNGKELIQEAGGEMIAYYENFNLAEARLSVSAYETLRQSELIHHIERNIEISLDEQFVEWGPLLIQAPSLWESDLTGHGVKIGIIDSGIAAHNDLRIAGGASFVSYTTSYRDDNGHGTHVTGIASALDNQIGIKGIASGADIYALKAFDHTGTGTLSSMIAALDWAVKNEMDIVNMSLGSEYDSSAARRAIEQAEAEGVLMIASSGNNGQKSGHKVSYPAAYPETIAVGAVDRNRNYASFSSVGTAVDLVAPGTDIGSTYLNERYVRMSGTSMAAPYVTGAAALLMEKYPAADSQWIKEQLLEAAVDLGSPGRDIYYGEGLLQLQMLTGLTAPDQVKVIEAPEAVQGLVGEKQKVNATALLENGEVLDLARNDEAVWRSLNSRIAEVTDGEVYFKQAGETEVTVTYQDKTRRILVTVLPVLSAESSLSGTIGEDLLPQVMVKTAVGESRVLDSDEGKWLLSDDQSLVINPDGSISLVRAGEYNLTVTFMGSEINIPIRVKGELRTDSLIQGQPGDTFLPELRYYISKDQFEYVSLEELNAEIEDPSIAAIQDGVILFQQSGSTVLMLTYKGISVSVPIIVEELSAEGSINDVFSTEFNDVSSDYWASEQIMSLVNKGIIKGYIDSTFRPEQSIKRSHVALLLSRVIDLPVVQSSAAYQDVPQSYLYYEEIMSMQQAGIFTKTPDFKPEAALTRAQMAKILVLSFGLEGKTDPGFEDIPSDHWAAEYIKILYHNGVTTGSNGQFRPNDPVTRAQYAVFLERVLR
ncbi:methionine adenosyltransferase [Jeotgalibacillus alimentarius]|uniref:Methionine adenosyltransferase n=1 Tax=Jeotgalibacillus alimentarius TaxID=135826 RepID=A0A0C2RY34_9BACL|nr:S8 family serine peptidase [Jeotgalibacillus alimentarius]KIL46699.1 methionine adenosyltransferase [Jeotgalibacillus alimentarius]